MAEILSRRGRHDPALVATVVARSPLCYAEAAAPALDRPAHVRAASGLAWAGDELVAVQDDANFLARFDPSGGPVRAIALPRGAGGRRQFDDALGNRADKLDLESCLVVAGVLWAFGSGSSARREVVLRADLGREPAAVSLHPAPALYAALRAVAGLGGAALNLEGAALAGGRLVLAQRGNGAGTRAAPALVELAADAVFAHVLDPAAPVPAIQRVTHYQLGALAGVALGFTDLAAGPDRLHFLAAAEASADALGDGPVAGCALGVLDDDGDARWAPLTDRAGRPLALKPEGLAHARSAGEVLAVIDMDDPARPSELLHIALAGPW